MIGNLRDSVEKDAAIRRVQRLQPAGGPGDKIFPPTYPGDGTNAPPRHVSEIRRIEGQNVECVLIDSVQSQANRLEEALLAASSEGLIELPMIAVDFADTAVGDIGRITSLEAPHRIFDAIIRDAELEGVPFRESAPGRRLQEAKMQNATAVLELSPSALVFGAWNSTGEGGGLGAKFPRCIVSEITGVGAILGKRTSSRIDPLGIRRDVSVYRKPDGDWTLDKTEAGTNAKALRPSEINHSNIMPSVDALGVTIDYAVHSAVVSLAGLRRLSFPDGDGVVTQERDQAGRTLLAALALVSLAKQDSIGYALRSRCDLVPERTASYEIVRSDGSTESIPLELGDAVKALKEAIGDAEQRDFVWSPEPLILRPQGRLVELVQRSRERALEGAEGAVDGG